MSGNVWTETNMGFKYMVVGASPPITWHADRADQYGKSWLVYKEGHSDKKKFYGRFPAAVGDINRYIASVQ